MGSHPTTIGKYRVDSVIGGGGMGMVYRAFDPVLEVPVAIKVIRGDADVKRFFVEAKSTASMRQCPNIVTVYDFGEQDGNPYLVMEFLEGISLESMIKNRTPLALSEKLRIVIDVLNGLGYAHERNIVHRDIKPANIIVLGDGTAKIVDFGIARIGDTTGLTNPNTVMGTLEYMSPESFLGKKLDPTTDIWATGVLLYQLLTGRSPFKLENENNPAPVINRVINEPPPPLEDYLHEHLNEFKAIFGKALAKNREERYPTAKEFALDVMQIQQQLKTEDAARYFREGEEAARAQEYKKAWEMFNEAVKIDPQNTTARRRLHEVSEVLRVVQKKQQVTRLQEDAKNEWNAKRYEPALNLVNEAIHLDGTNQELKALREAIENDKNIQAKLASSLGDARNALQRGQYKTASDLVQGVLVLSPNDTQARTLDGLIRKKLEEQERQEQFKKLVEQTRKQISAGDLAAAAKTLEAASKVDSSSPELTVLSAQLSDARHQADREKTLHQLNREIEAAFKADDYQTALAKVNQGLDEFPGEKSLLDLKSIAEGQLAETDKKSSLNEQVNSINALLQEERFDEARELAERAVANYPGEAMFETLRRRVEEKAAQAEQKTKVFTRSQIEAQRKGRPQPPSSDRRPSPAPAGGDLSATAVISSGSTAPQAPLTATPAARTDTARISGGAATAPKLAPVPAPPLEAPKAHPVPAVDRTLRFPAKQHAEAPPPKSKLPIFIGAAVVLVAIIAGVAYFTMSGGKTTVVSFKVDPAGADVAVGSQHCAAPCDLKLDRGQAVAKVTQDGYEAKEQDITIGTDAQTVEVKLEPKAVVEKQPPKLRIQTNVDGAVVYVDDVPKAATSGDKAAVTVTPGKHQVRLEKDGYKPETQSVEIAANADSSLTINLNKAEAGEVAATPTKLFVIVEGLPGANVSVDGSPAGKIGGDHTLTQEVKKEGAHKIEVSLDGYTSFTQRVNVKPGPPASIFADIKPIAVSANLSVSSASVKSGQDVTLTWQTQNAKEVTLDGAPVNPSGSKSVAIKQPTTFTLVARGVAGEPITRVEKVDVAKTPPPAIVTFEAGADSIYEGQKVKLTWETQNASEVSIDGYGNVSPPNRGVVSVQPTSTASYTLVAKNSDGVVTKSEPVRIEVKVIQTQVAQPPPQQPAVAAVNPDIKAVLDLKDRYVDAYDSMSVEAERSVWPGIPAERAKVDQDTFKKMRAMRLRLDCGSPSITGDAATLACTQTLQRTTSSGKLENDPPVRIALGFKKSGGSWIIASVRGQQ